MLEQDIREYAPILTHKNYNAPSVFTPESLIREARRQKQVLVGKVPSICILDPDGDLVDYLRKTGQARQHPCWACYHSNMDIFDYEGVEYGIIGRAVGAPFAVLVAEELFATGCELLISISSAGQIRSLGTPPYVVLVEKALRDEGTSYHYLPPTKYSTLHPTLQEMLYTSWNHGNIPLYSGKTWTTDAPFRETEAMIAACEENDILAVEMEIAALYALATAKSYNIVCFAYVTNQMGRIEGDFEKGDEMGSHAALRLVDQTAQSWHTR
ncbi:MAG TPA: nucleoside phosphorylase [Ktedonobacteraceae bacterium]|nr:nucleoside phosphorylase [Ktedonobacteraceae bacterium]